MRFSMSIYVFYVEIENKYSIFIQFRPKLKPKTKTLSFRGVLQKNLIFLKIVGKYVLKK